MAERIIRWSETAQRQRLNVLRYWNKRTGSPQYSNKLIQLIYNRLQIIKNNPEAFDLIGLEEIRRCEMGNFSLFYVFNTEEISIVNFWDNRQDPDKLKDIIERST